MEVLWITAMLLQDLHNNRDQILALVYEHGGRNLRVFGSVARGEIRPGSDIDFLVDFPRGYDIFRQRLALAEKLSELLGCKVDLIPEHELNSHFRDSILNEAVYL